MRVQINVTSSGAMVALSFSVPVVVRPEISPNASGAVTLASQTVVNLQQVEQVYSSSAAGMTYSIPANCAVIATF